MAHDFGIFTKKRTGHTRECAFFHGFCEGVMYVVFDAEDHNMGISGDGSGFTVTYDKAKSALDTAILYFDHSEYPDPTRMDDIKRFRAKMDQELKDEKAFDVWFA